MDAVVWFHLLSQHRDARICEKGGIQSIGSFPVSNLLREPKQRQFQILSRTKVPLLHGHLNNIRGIED